MRAANLQSIPQVTEISEEVTVVCFSLGEKKYGADVQQVFEAIRMVEITEIPDAPSFVAGVINLRGKVIPIIDLRKRFRIPSVSSSPGNVILIAEIEGKTVGLIVDGVDAVLTVPRSSVELPEEIDHSLELTEKIVKLPEGLLPILDFEKILDFEEKKELELVAGSVGEQ